MPAPRRAIEAGGRGRRGPVPLQACASTAGADADCRCWREERHAPLLLLCRVQLICRRCGHPPCRWEAMRPFSMLLGDDAAIFLARCLLLSLFFMIDRCLFIQVEKQSVVQIINRLRKDKIEYATS